MSQTTRRQISGKRDALDAAQGFPFHEILSQPMVEQALVDEGVEYNSQSSPRS